MHIPHGVTIIIQKVNVLRIAQNKIIRLIFNLKSRVKITSTYINNNIMSFDNIIFYKTCKIMYIVFINDCHINIGYNTICFN